jgi:large subunit ribosomal protein L10
MNRTQKNEAVGTLQGDFAKSPNAILFGFTGLKVAEVTELRRQVRGTQSKYLVVKNTLALRAAKGTALESIASHFTGPTAVVFNANNAVAIAKVLTAFAKTNPHLVFKAALVEGRPIAAAEIQAIADLPTREELIARLLFLMESPLRRLATVLSAPARSLASVMAQIAEQKPKTAGAAEAAPAGSE